MADQDSYSPAAVGHSPHSNSWQSYTAEAEDEEAAAVPADHNTLLHTVVGEEATDIRTAAEVVVVAADAMGDEAEAPAAEVHKAAVDDVAYGVGAVGAVEYIAGADYGVVEAGEYIADAAEDDVDVIEHAHTHHTVPE